MKNRKINGLALQTHYRAGDYAGEPCGYSDTHCQPRAVATGVNLGECLGAFPSVSYINCQAAIRKLGYDPDKGPYRCYKC